MAELPSSIMLPWSSAEFVVMSVALRVVSIGVEGPLILMIPKS